SGLLFQRCTCGGGPGDPGFRLAAAAAFATGTLPGDARARQPVPGGTHPRPVRPGDTRTTPARLATLEEIAMKTVLTLGSTFLLLLAANGLSAADVQIKVGKD